MYHLCDLLAFAFYMKCFIDLFYSCFAFAIVGDLAKARIYSNENFPLKHIYAISKNDIFCNCVNLDDSKEDDITCASCFNGLQNEEFISALGQNYHIDCFRCSVCDHEMWNTNFYFEKNGLLFCKDDYWQKFGEFCQQCSNVVSGPIMICGDHRFHPECFCCRVCKNVIGDGDSYALIERSELFCGSW